jgi:hypothetical protein
MYVGMMRELRDYNDDLEQLYKDLIYVSILQGTYQSSISIKNVIPIEDYSVIVQPIIVSLADDGDLAAFAEGMFHANNFKNDDIMPVFQPRFKDVSVQFKGEEATPDSVQLDSFGNHYADIYLYYSSMFPKIDAFNIKSSERKILLLSTKYDYIASQKNYIKIPRVVTDKYTGDSIDMKTGLSITKLDYALRKAKGDYSLKDVYGYARVNYPDTNIPLTTVDEYGDTKYVYKLINLYGDGDRSSEFYKDFRPSVLENGTAIMNQIIPNNKIIEYYGGEVVAEDVSLPTTEEMPSKKLFSFEKGITKKSFRGKPLNFVDVIPTEKLTPVAMRNNRATGVISVSTKEMINKFNNKAWTTPAEQLDGSYATPLAKDEFKSRNEWFTFALLHEVKHDTIFKTENETTGQYEDRINQAALEDLRTNYIIPSSDKYAPEGLPPINRTPKQC